MLGFFVVVFLAICFNYVCWREAEGCGHEYLERPENGVILWSWNYSDFELPGVGAGCVCGVGGLFVFPDSQKSYFEIQPNVLTG